MKSKLALKVYSSKGKLIAPKASSVLSHSSKPVAGSSLSQKSKENAAEYMVRTHASFAKELASSPLDTDRGALAGRVLKRS